MLLGLAAPRILVLRSHARIQRVLSANPELRTVARALSPALDFRGNSSECRCDGMNFPSLQCVCQWYRGLVVIWRATHGGSRRSGGKWGRLMGLLQSGVDRPGPVTLSLSAKQTTQSRRSRPRPHLAGSKDQSACEMLVRLFPINFGGKEEGEEEGKKRRIGPCYCNRYNLLLK